MDSLTFIELLRFLRVVGHAVTATYLVHLMFHRQRDQWLYGVLAVQFAGVVIWAGLGLFIAGFEATYRPWQTGPVLLTVIVIARDYLQSRSQKTQALRWAESELAGALGSTSANG